MLNTEATAESVRSLIGLIKPNFIGQIVDTVMGRGRIVEIFILYNIKYVCVEITDMTIHWKDRFDMYLDSVTQITNYNEGDLLKGFAALN